MDNVAYDVYQKFPELPPNVEWGEVSVMNNYLVPILYLNNSSFLYFQVKNVATNLCLDTLGYAAPTLIGLGLCHGHGNNQVNNFTLKHFICY